MERERSNDVCEKLASELLSSSISDVKCPKDAFEFDTHWRRACTTTKSQIRYLKTIPGDKYRQIFKVEGSLSKLGEIIQALSIERKENSNPEYDDFVFKALQGLMRVKGISMAIAFLDEELELDVAKQLCEDLILSAKSDKREVSFTPEDARKILEKFAAEQD
mmetsp:Transcript_24838/g.44194  ORF Transcript_24838/g.44194 Transcript_24838/m.44194 type:complete len:163 (-) Transcript_24838:253-741(-)